MSDEEIDDWFTQEQLHIAAANGDLLRVKELIAQGYDVNAFDSPLSWTPLHHAVKEARIEVAEYLLSVNADVNANDERQIGETPLGQVAEICSFEIAELLVKAGADPLIPGWMQIPAILRSKSRKDVDGLRVHSLLIRAGESIHGKKAVDPYR